ncbi:MAG: hypothetical protein U9R56_02420 [candidate division Zixibacteria bacterium]|nr:hypothetical protein [candidate division Zixibacteria bacterium]
MAKNKRNRSETDAINGKPSQNEYLPDIESRVLEWTCHPMRRRPLVSVLTTIFIVVVGIVVFYSTNSRAFAVLALVVMCLSLAKFYFPTSYRLTKDKLIVKTTTQTLARKWSQYRSCYPDKNGILLSPFPVPSRLENFRGLYLMFSDNRDEVTAFVKTCIRKDDEKKRVETEENDG